MSPTLSDADKRIFVVNQIIADKNADVNMIRNNVISKQITDPVWADLAGNTPLFTAVKARITTGENALANQPMDNLKNP
jgi:hypothetical protein